MNTVVAMETKIISCVTVGVLATDTLEQAYAITKLAICVWCVLRSNGLKIWFNLFRLYRN